MDKTKKINTAIDYVFRHEYSKLISLLTVKFGTANIDLIEDGVQDALYKAMKLWPFNKMPSEPRKWLYRVAYNNIIDQLRRNSKTVSVDFISHEKVMSENTSYPAELFEDEKLKMIFACCHPSLKEIEQIMLSLKLLCGFSNKEIGKALLKEEASIKKAIYRAKEKFKTNVQTLEIPAQEELTERLESVLKVIYLIFNSGYTAASGEEVIKKELCQEAIGLGELLYRKKQFNTPKLRAILALMFFNIARFDSRVDKSGSIVILENQDRGSYDEVQILKGIKYFQESAEGNFASNYHFESAIAYEYTLAENFDSIDWKSILRYYDYLNLATDNPITKLNRLVVLEKLEGPRIALKSLKELDSKVFEKYHLFFAIKADFEKKLGLSSYVDNLKTAIKLTDNIKEKELLFNKI